MKYYWFTIKYEFKKESKLPNQPNLDQKVDWEFWRFVDVFWTLIWALSEDRYRGDIKDYWMVQTLRGKTPGVGKVPNPNTRIDTFENRQNLTDKK